MSHSLSPSPPVCLSILSWLMVQSHHRRLSSTTSLQGRARPYTWPWRCDRLRHDCHQWNGSPAANWRARSGMTRPRAPIGWGWRGAELSDEETAAVFNWLLQTAQFIVQEDAAATIKSWIHDQLFTVSYRSLVSTLCSNVSLCVFFSRLQKNKTFGESWFQIVWEIFEMFVFFFPFHRPNTYISCVIWPMSPFFFSRQLRAITTW